MVYTSTWNASFESTPAGGDNISGGDDSIRALKVAVRERLAKDHYMEIAGTDADHGEHAVVTLRVQSKPSAAADKGFLYTKDVGGKAELHFLDEDGNECQITSAGGIPSSSVPGDGFAAGTSMLFYQNSAPAGWTIDTSANDRLVYVTKGSAAGGHTGGAVHPSGSWTISGLSDAGHTHGPGSYQTQYNHNHQWYNATDAVQPDRTYNSDGISTNITKDGTQKTSSVYVIQPVQISGDYGLIDGYTTPAGAANPTEGTSSSGQGSISQDGTWRPHAYCCIICTKA